MKISIITPTMNSGETIASNIKSIHQQNFKNVEQIFVDGKSKDKTLDIIRNQKKDVDILVSEPDMGIYDAINKGIEISSGEIIGVLNSDDILCSNDVLFKIHESFLKNFDYVYGDIKYIDNNAKVVRTWKSGKFTQRMIDFGWMPPHPSLYIKKDVIKQIGLYNLEYSISSDFEYINRLFREKELSYDYLDFCMVKMLVGGVSNKSLKSILKKSQQDLTILKQYSNYPLIAFLCKNFSKILQFVKK